MVPLQTIPIVLGVIFIATAIWNSFLDRRVGQWLRNWGLSPHWRYAVAGIELLTAVLLLAGGGTIVLGMLLAPLILFLSIGLSLFQGAYRRLWLSVPMLVAVAYWYGQLPR
jgi:hypothetical protein